MIHFIVFYWRHNIPPCLSFQRPTGILLCARGVFWFVYIKLSRVFIHRYWIFGINGQYFSHFFQTAILIFEFDNKIELFGITLYLFVDPAERQSDPSFHDRSKTVNDVIRTRQQQDTSHLVLFSVLALKSRNKIT